MFFRKYVYYLSISRDLLFTVCAFNYSLGIFRCVLFVTVPLCVTCCAAFRFLVIRVCLFESVCTTAKCSGTDRESNYLSLMATNTKSQHQVIENNENTLLLLIFFAALQCTAALVEMIIAYSYCFYCFCIRFCDNTGESKVACDDHAHETRFTTVINCMKFCTPLSLLLAHFLNFFLLFAAISISFSFRYSLFLSSSLDYLQLI